MIYLKSIISVAFGPCEGARAFNTLQHTFFFLSEVLLGSPDQELKMRDTTPATGGRCVSLRAPLATPLN